MKLNIGKSSIPNEKVENVLERMIQIAEQALASVEELKTYAIDAATKKDALARKKATATVLNKDTGRSQEIRDAFADKDFAEERLASFLADALKESQSEKVKTLRQVLSSMQTYITAEKAVANMLGYGQDHSV